MALQIGQQLLGLVSVGGEVRGNDVHVVAGTDSLLLFVDLGLVQIGDLPLDLLDCLGLIQRLNVHPDHQVGFHIQEVRQNAVLKLRGQDLKEAGLAVFLPHTEHSAVGEGKGAGSDEVLGGQTGQRQPVPGKPEGRLGVHVQDVVHNPQILGPRQGVGKDPELLEVCHEIALDLLQAALCLFEAVLFHGESQIFGALQAVLALSPLVAEHFGVLSSHAVKFISGRRNINRGGDMLLRC